MILKPLALALVLVGCGGGGGGDNPPADTPELTVTKAAVNQSQTPAMEGTVIDYEITATNTGNIDLTNVVVSDSMLTPTSASCATLAMGADCVLTGSYTVTAADVTAGEVANTASGDSNETNPVNSNTVTVNVPNGPELTVVKTLSGQSEDPVREGTVLSYTVAANNSGNIGLTNIVITDSMLNPASDSCSTLATGNNCILTGTYTVTAADVTAGEVQNTASADSDQTNSTDSNTVTVNVPNSPSLSVSKALTDQSDDPATEGTVLEYTVTATNDGNIALTSVVVSDGMLSPSSANCATLAIGADCVLTGTYTVTTSDVATGEVENTATADSAETSPTNSNTVTVTISTPPAPALSMSKSLTSQSETPAVAGTTLNYTVTATNSGNVPLSGVVVSDGMLSPSSANCATLAVGADCVLTGNYTVTAGDVAAGEVQNTANGNSNETNSVNSNTVTVNVPNTPALSVAKALTSQSETPAVEGTTLTYTVTATNSGSIALTSVVVTDSMLTPTSQSCATLAIGADCVLTGFYIVTAADVTAGSVQNTASADSAQTSSVNSNTVTVGVGDPADSGLDVRPSNTTCLAPERPSNSAGYRLEQVFEGLGNLREPLWMGQPPGDNSRWFVATRFRNGEDVGRIFSFANTPGVSATTTVLDVPITNPPNEGGLLGFAFAPDFATSGEAYVSYTREVTGGSVDLQSVVSRFTSADGGITLNPASEEEILVINQPFGNHNGGNIAFGPDGYLYFGLGDGGSISDPQNNAQTTTNVLGSFVRVDVSGGGTGYTIPPDNPFASNPVCMLGSGDEPCPEIYAWGLRNPFRWNFDPATGDLWAGDVGNLLREEVSVIEKGGNYGWVTKEGFVCLDPNDNNGILASCDDAGMIDPIIDYNSGNSAGDLGRTVIGGVVYRGDQLPGLQGKYIFGDSYSSNIWTLEDDGNGNVSLVDLIPNAGIFISHFVEGIDGELYVVNLSGGIYEIVEDSSSGTNTIPDSLIDTGCVDASDPTQPASGLIPYAPGAPFWSDGADKQRWIAVPNGTQVTVSGEDFVFPEGSIMVKNFERGGDLIETRLLMNHINGGGWAGYTYRWNTAQTEATRVVGGATLPAGGSDWVYPSEAQCLDCHTAAANRVLGPEIPQLNNVINYPTTGRDANQLATLDHIMLLNPPLGTEPANLPALPDPFGSAPLEDRARAYLHTNCSGCHRPGTPLQATMDLRYDTALADTNACNADSVTGGNLGIANAKLIAPGDAARSLVPVRMNLRDANAMPPIGSLIADSGGVTLINQWINSLSSCL